MLVSALSMLLAAQDATYVLHPERDLGPIQFGVLGVNAPDKYMDWGSDPRVADRIREGGFRFVRTGLVQDGFYQKRDIYPAPGKYDFRFVDRNLKQIIAGGAEPIVSIVGFPAGVPHRLKDGKIVSADWDAYARFIEGVIRHYNVDLAIRKKIVYWELWNEPTDEPDGKFQSKEQYAEFVRMVAPIIRAVDPQVRLIGPVAPWSDMSPEGWPAFAARELGKHIDVICWHDYGGQSDQSDADRMAWPRAHYFDNVRTVMTAKQFASPPGKTFGTAITEYNMSWGDGPPEYLAKYRSEYNAAFLGASLVQAFRSGMELFCQYTLTQAGRNNLGLVDNTTFEPYRPFYVYAVFSKHIGTRKLEIEGDAPGLEALATKRPLGITVHLVNTRPSIASVTVQGLPNGRIRMWQLDAKKDGRQPDSGEVRGQTLKLSLPPRSVTAVEAG